MLSAAFAMEQQELEAAAPVLDDRWIGTTTRLTFPMHDIAVKMVAVLRSIRRLLLRHEEPDGAEAPGPEHAGVDRRIIDGELFLQVGARVEPAHDQVLGGRLPVASVHHLDAEAQILQLAPHRGVAAAEVCRPERPLCWMLEAVRGADDGLAVVQPARMAEVEASSWAEAVLLQKRSRPRASYSAIAWTTAERSVRSDKAIVRLIQVQRSLKSRSMPLSGRAILLYQNGMIGGNPRPWRWKD
jgi:hypothetical protein